MESIANGISDEREILIITENEAGQRADVALAAMLELTRSNMQKLLDEGRAVKGTKVIKSNYKLKLGDEIIVTLPEPQPLDVQPENIPLDIIYEDEDGFYQKLIAPNAYITFSVNLTKNFSSDINGSIYLNAKMKNFTNDTLVEYSLLFENFGHHCS